MKQILPILFILFIFSSQSTYHISPFGDDETGRGTSQYPWKTLQKAYNAAQNGDTIKVAVGAYINQEVEVSKAITIEGAVSGEYQAIFRKSNINISAPVTLKNLVFDPILAISQKGQVASTSSYIKVTELYIGKDAKLQAHHVIVNKTLVAESGSIVQLTNSILRGDQVIQERAGLYVKSSETVNLQLTVYGTASFDNVTFVQSESVPNPYVRVVSGKLFCDNCNFESKTYPPAIYGTDSIISISKSSILNIGRTTSTGRGGAIYVTGCETRISDTLIADNTAESGAAFYCFGGVFNIQNSEISRNKAYYSAEGFCLNQCAYGERNVVYKNNTSTSYRNRCNIA